MERLGADQPLVADLYPDRVEEHQRMGRIERAGLPCGDLLEYGVGDGRYQVRRNVDAVHIAQMPGDLPGAHAVRVHRDDLVVEAWKAALIFGDQLRVEPALPVARHIDVDVAGVGHHRLAAIAIPAVVRFGFVAQVMIHLGIERAFRQRLLQGIEQAALIQRRRRIAARQKLIE